MSRTFKATTHKKIEWQEFLNALRELRDDTQAVNRHPIYYFYNNNFSARGVDVTEEADGFEIRTTACSNAADYLLANRIAFKIKEFTDAVFTDESNRELSIGTLFYDKNIADNTFTDIESLKALLNTSNDIVLYGPNRPFHIQKVFAKKINEITGDKHAIAYKFSKMLLHCQYPPDEFVTGENFMSIGAGEENEYLVQGFFNTHDMILENVKAIALGYEDKKPVLIEPKHLVQFLPDRWELLDEFTIAARVLPAEEWFTLYHSMIPFQISLQE